MENFLDQIDKLRSSLKSKEDTLKEVISKIKEEQSERFYYPSEEDDFRFAMFLFFGSYTEKYSLVGGIGRNYDIRKHTNYPKKFEKYFDILYRKYYDIASYDSIPSGFICYGTNLYNAIEPYLLEMWKFAIENNKYLDSFENYKTQISKLTTDSLYFLFDAFISHSDVNRYRDYILTTIKHPGLKLKKTVIFIKK